MSNSVAYPITVDCLFIVFGGNRYPERKLGDTRHARVESGTKHSLMSVMSRACKRR